ncbi:DUF2515 family protein [Paenibacillus thermotolerans]|uniref:DUF2515 family protein n=1 Tax=Paenibacillus thermotolerans TaxID=3027807 RepID=UPI002368726E|nr:MULTISPECIES: DUF2515 family protein [unclassified Paenibacillus]
MNGSKSFSIAGLWGKLIRLPEVGAGPFASLAVDPRELKRLKGEWERLGPPGPPGQYNAPETGIIEDIKTRTRLSNRNNVTRTAAYFSIFHKHPELHWALLAHMVSRNGGWSMTDLKGELLPRILPEPMRERLFDMLETANAFIFGDAYPQLLLYQESVGRGRPLFHLLPAFGVSSFMKPVWRLFWETRSSVPLTIAMIVNEQHYIEKRVVQLPEFASGVLNTLPFQAQSALQLNQVFFPYGGESPVAAGRQRIAGGILEDFGSLKERILFGKKLYGILFGIPEARDGARRFAQTTPHTGSRADYWPELFAAVRRGAPSSAYMPKLDGTELLPDAAPFYSPRLADAWKDKPLREPERFDWFRGNASDAAGYFTDVRPSVPYEMSAEHCYGLEKLELAALAGSLLL